MKEAEDNAAHSNVVRSDDSQSQTKGDVLAARDLNPSRDLGQNHTQSGGLRRGRTCSNIPESLDEYVSCTLALTIPENLECGRG